MRSMIRSSQPEPSRHGVHWPHDSREKNLVIRQAARTAQVWSSMTTTEPDPSIEPASATSSWPRGRSIWSGPNHGADTPPGMNAFSPRPCGMPPPSTGALIRSLKVVLTISSSYTPGLATWPARANSRVPVERPAAEGGEGRPAVES